MRVVVGSERGDCGESTRVDHLVRDEDVITEAGGGEPECLPRRCDGEGMVTSGGLASGNGGGLVGLDVRAQPRARMDCTHRRQVRLERIGVDDRCGRREFVDQHQRASVPEVASLRAAQPSVPAVGLEPTLSRS